MIVCATCTATVDEDVDAEAKVRFLLAVRVFLDFTDLVIDDGAEDCFLGQVLEDASRTRFVDLGMDRVLVDTSPKSSTSIHSTRIMELDGRGARSATSSLISSQSASDSNGSSFIVGVILAVLRAVRLMIFSLAFSCLALFCLVRALY